MDALPSVSPAPPSRQPSPPPLAVLPFNPPPLSSYALTGSLDLLQHLNLLSSYDAFVRPYFRSSLPGSAPPTATTLPATTTAEGDVKGKGRESADLQQPPAPGRGEEEREKSMAGMRKRGAVMSLKRMKGDYEDLVPECVVLPNEHPSIRIPPSSFHRLIMEGTDESGVPPPLVIRPASKVDLERFGWRLAEGELPEAKDPSLFVRQPKPVKPKKKTKRPRPVDIPGAPTSHDAKRVKESHGDSPAGSALTPRTPGMGAGTPSGRTPGAASGRGRTPAVGTPAGGR